MAVKVFQGARAGLETTPGTPVTPTRFLYPNEITPRHQVATIRRSSLRNSLFGFLGASKGPESNGVTLAGDVSFQFAAWAGNVYVKAVGTGVGGAADKTYAFLPIGGSDDTKAATIQYGFNDGIGATRPAAEIAGCRGQTLGITWDKTANDGAVTYSAVLDTHKLETQLSAFTGALSDVTQVYASAIKTQLYIDSTTIGTTADNDAFMFEWVLDNHYAARQTINNSAAAQEMSRVDFRQWALRITRYYANDTELDAYNAGTIRKVRIRTEGPALGGSTYKIDLDLYGVYDTDYGRELNDAWGAERYVLVPVLDTGIASDFSLTVVTNDVTVT